MIKVIITFAVHVTSIAIDAADTHLIIFLQLPLSVTIVGIFSRHNFITRFNQAENVNTRSGVQQRNFLM